MTVKNRTAIPYACFILVLYLLVGCAASPPTETIPIPKNAIEKQVERVVDGDTFVTTTGDKIRLIGINTPESVDPRRPVEYMGKEASKYTESLIEGKKVLVQWGQTPKDRYGRWLAWVWLADGTFVNGHLVREGFAQVYTFKDNPDHATYLLQLEKAARAEGRGLWAESQDSQQHPLPGQAEEHLDQASGAVEPATYVASQNSDVYHEKGCPGAKGIAEKNLVVFQSREEAEATGRRMCKSPGCTIK